ncbi:hypothetical protein ACA30_13330 [Virgibacillus soli]|nr:hypothetical protein ACA30_13330 [Virgibacillus soli]
MVLCRIEEDIELAECRGCDRQTFVKQSLYDKRFVNHFCDEDCFKDWSFDITDLIVEFYRKMNVY